MLYRISLRVRSPRNERRAPGVTGGANRGVIDPGNSSERLKSRLRLHTVRLRGYRRGARSRTQLGRLCQRGVPAPRCRRLMLVLGLMAGMMR
jgi:hypothetical protein